MKKIILFITVLFFITCASPPVKYHPLSDVNYSRTTKVDVYKTEKPTQEYTEMGRIEVKGKEEKENELYELAIKKAKEIGADGIILISEKQDTELVDMLKEEEIMGVQVPLKQLIFMAIKYVEKKPKSPSAKDAS